MERLPILIILRFACLSILAALFSANIVSADTSPSPIERMEGLVMPGEVVRAHARFEQKCDKCHELFDRSRQRKLCRDCHEQIDTDIKKKTNFHGKIHDIAERECHSCHTDHKGRDMDIIQFDEEVFDHNRTNFTLNGAHKLLACKTCHKKDRFYRLPKHDCFDCHERDDSHKSSMGDKCENCHIEAAWIPAVFNHAKTDFPLRNNHRNVGCQYCHVNERYKDTPKNCYFCHYLDDVHKGDRGIKCHECHYDERWSRIEFNHDKDTNFKLNEAHKRLLCEDCHEGNVFKDKVKTVCYACHEDHDAHNGNYGKRCAECHTEEDWRKIDFNHDKDTKFKLKGAHKDLICEACHKGHLFDEKTPDECNGCHGMDDVHAGQEGQACTKCHNEKGWTVKVIFDHDLTKFPLHGSHPLLTCEDCHVSGMYKEAKVSCNACHEKDDVHKKKLTVKCELCHGATDWLIWQFDHDTQSDYPLDGKHKGLDCHACHSEPIKKKIELPKNCFGCHEKDDTHSGQLGRQCEKCHKTSSFRDIEIKT